MRKRHERNRELLEMAATGRFTLLELSRRFGISSQRVHQLVRSAGVAWRSLRPAGGVYRDAEGYMRGTRNNKRVHITIVEAVLGKALPRGAQVHHVNGDRADNRAANLVVCQDAAYHHLLHVRARALAACGHASWRKCYVCGHYDDPTNLAGRSPHHRACLSEYARERYRARQESRMFAAGGRIGGRSWLRA